MMKHAIQRARVPRFECMTHGPHLEYGICGYIAETRVVVGLRIALGFFYRKKVTRQLHQILFFKNM